MKERFERLSSAERWLCASYAALAVAALVGTQIALVRHLTTYDGTAFGGLDDTVVNAAATFVVIDLLAIAVVALLFMLVEGRRLGMRFLWVYVVLTFAVAVSVALPLFLIARQVHLAGQRPARS